MKSKLQKDLRNSAAAGEYIERVEHICMYIERLLFWLLGRWVATYIHIYLYIDDCECLAMANCQKEPKIVSDTWPKL